MHDPVPQTGGWLKSVVQGYFNYYAVPGNLTSLGVFRDRVLALWWRTLRRRSQKRPISWTRILGLAQRWLPQPCRLHPFPDARFAATHPRYEPDALISARPGLYGGQPVMVVPTVIVNVPFEEPTSPTEIRPIHLNERLGDLAPFDIDRYDIDRTNEAVLARPKSIPRRRQICRTAFRPC